MKHKSNIVYSKRSYFPNYFQNKLSDLKSRWKVIKNVISLKELRNVVPSNFLNNDQSLTESQEIVNAFNKHFGNVATGIQFLIRKCENNFHGFILLININHFFSQPH